MQAFNISSIGRAAQLLQLHPVRITEVAKALNVQPTIVINDVAHYSREDIERIAAFVRASERPQPPVNLQPFN